MNIDKSDLNAWKKQLEAEEDVLLNEIERLKTEINRQKGRKHVLMRIADEKLSGVISEINNKIKTLESSLTVEEARNNTRLYQISAILNALEGYLK